MYTIRGLSKRLHDDSENPEIFSFILLMDSQEEKVGRESVRIAKCKSCDLYRYDSMML